MTTKKVLKKLLGGGVALALSMAMVLGIFAGTGMEVKAEEEKWVFEDITDNLPDSYIELLGKCSDGFSLDERNEIIASEKMKGNAVYIMRGSYEGGTMLLFWIPSLKGGDGFFNDEMYSKLKTLYPSSSYKYYIVKKNNIYNSGSGSASTDSNAPSVPHTHSYSWVTVQDVSSEQDGIEEYRCSCGDVQERCVIPRYMAIVKGLFGEIKNAPQNGTATFDSGRLYTISDYVIKKLAERTDVTTVITFEYQNQSYKMTIPAGADFTGLLADEEYFYGYFYFANAVGATIEAL